MKTRTLFIAALVVMCIAATILGYGWLFADQDNGAAAGQGEVAPEAPHSPAAVESKRKYDLSVKLAKEAYRKALLAADQKYISELEEELKAAMNGGPLALEEAKRLDTARIAAINVMEQDKQEGELHTVNLLLLIDVTKDAVSGTWRLDHGAMVSDNSSAARLRIPYEPPEEYDYHIEFTRVSGNDDVNQMFRYSGHSCTLQMGGWGNTVLGYSQIDGMDAANVANPTHLGEAAVLQNGRKYDALIQVRKGSVVTLLDGKIVVKCSLDPSKFSATQWSVGADGLGLGTWSSPAVFSVIEVTEISGPGKMLTHDR